MVYYVRSPQTLIQDSTWIVVHGHVYDWTSFIKDHSGGTDSILINAGTDCMEFDAIYSNKAKAMINTCCIDELIVTSYSSDNSIHGGFSLSNLVAINEASRNPIEALTNP